MPPGGRLPAAETEVPVTAPVGDFIARLSPLLVARLRLALRAFELSPLSYGRPRRFSRLSAAARTAHLERMESSRVALRRDLALLLKSLAGIGYARDRRVQEAVGYSARCALPDGAEPERPPVPPLDPADMTPPEGGEQCDVVVVGSGAGGAAAARVLAEAGLDVVVLEEGAYHDRSSYPDDPLAALPALYRDSGLTVCEGRPLIPLPVGRCVGGTTVINSGTCFRTPEAVLAGWHERAGIPWATPEALDPHFEAIEQELQVRPVEVERMGRNGQLCMEGAAALGASGGPISRNAGRCDQCGTCPTGCQIDAKQATHVATLPLAVAAGARLRAGCRVDDLLVEGGQARGVRASVLDPEGPSTRAHEVRARAVVLAGGAIGTPALLQRWQGERVPSNPHTGRHLRIHPACWVGGLYDEQVRGWEGVMQSYYVDQWAAQAILIEATFTPFPFGSHWVLGAGEEARARLERYGQVASFGVHLSDRSEGRVRLDRSGNVRIGYRLDRDDARTMLAGIARAADLHFAAGATEVYPQVGREPVLRPGQQQAFQQARFGAHELRLEAFHPMGSARMGADPGASVAGPDGAVHGLRGLHIADASLFPSTTGVNPMITVMALARRISTELAERLAA